MSSDCTSISSEELWTVVAHSLNISFSMWIPYECLIAAAADIVHSLSETERRVPAPTWCAEVTEQLKVEGTQPGLCRRNFLLSICAHSEVKCRLVSTSAFSPLIVVKGNAKTDFDTPAKLCGSSDPPFPEKRCHKNFLFWLFLASLLCAVNPAFMFLWMSSLDGSINANMGAKGNL